MRYPTDSEIKAAYDAITADGEQAEVTTELCTLAILNPEIRDTVERTTKLLDDYRGTQPHLFRRSFVTSCIAKGLNFGMRISDARMAGMKSRGTIEDLLRHMKDGHCPGPGTAESIKVLEWVLGISHESQA